MGPTQREHLTRHAESASRLSASLAGTMGMASDEVARLRLAGLCHDIGKLFVPEEVLAKPGPLSTEERALVSRHAQEGAEVCLQLGMDAPTAECVRHHHARFDGEGSRQGPSGQAIPAGARVLAAADAFVTMTSERAYQAARSPCGALLELRRARGTQFDPAVVDAFCTAISSDSSLSHHPRPAWRHRPG